MKQTLLCALAAFALTGFAQNPIPNPGFENWTSGDPDGWETSNLFTLTPIMQSNDAHAGSSAARLEVIDDGGIPTPPLLNTGTISISQNYLSGSFYYKGNFLAGDNLLLSVVLKQNNTLLSVTNFSVGANTNIYTQKTFSLSYFTPVTATANKLEVQLGISGALFVSTVGSYAIVDDLEISGNLVVGGKELNTEEEPALGKAQPNPSSGLTLIPFSLNKRAEVHMQLLSLDGKILKDILHEEIEQGNYKAECSVGELPSGLYLCQLKIDGRSAYTKLLVE